MKRILSSILLVVFIATVFAGCSPSPTQIQDAYETFGGINAYYAELKNPATTKTYAIGNTPSGEYRDAAINACNKMNNITSKVNISYNTNTTGTWKMRTVTSGDIALNTITAEPNSSAVGGYYITGSDIAFNTTEMNKATANQKKYLALHEVGHTVGLYDLYNPKLNSNSDKQKAYDYILSNQLTVMLSAYAKDVTGAHSLTDYSEYDIRAIKDVYGS